MFLYRDQRGITIAFGFDMATRKADPGIICWDDGDGNWEPSQAAGSNRFHHSMWIAPEFVRESNAGSILAYQPGLMIEMTHVGPPLIFHFSLARN